VEGGGWSINAFQDGKQAKRARGAQLLTGREVTNPVITLPSGTLGKGIISERPRSSIVPMAALRPWLVESYKRWKIIINIIPMEKEAGGQVPVSHK
jgi:hypothetical protein